MPSRVYVGRLHRRATERDLEKFFKNYGKIADVMLKNGFGFVDFEDHKDAEDAVYELHGRELLGERVIVEHAKGPSGRTQRSSRAPKPTWLDNSRYGAPVRTGYKLIVENLSSRVSWQDLKDYMRQAGDVTFADAHKDRRNEGVVEFASSRDMRRALDKLDGTEINGRRIKLVEDSRNKSHSRSRSESRRSRSRSKGRRRRDSRRRSDSRSCSRSASRGRSNSHRNKNDKKRSDSIKKDADRSLSRGKDRRSRSKSSQSRGRTRSVSRNNDRRSRSRSDKRSRSSSNRSREEKKERQSNGRNSNKNTERSDKECSGSVKRDHRERSESVEKRQRTRSASSKMSHGKSRSPSHHGSERERSYTPKEDRKRSRSPESNGTPSKRQRLSSNESPIKEEKSHHRSDSE